ncbi:hypothetical protein AB0E08_08810 [Streptomyces sp. NPDC048281]|uniref:hypothetical protein n=1 Tax=Streptomyces sp. NPDC048281 TaxID=3154715 RepID=UPI00342D10E7
MTIKPVSTEQSTPAPLAPGDLIFVYSGPRCGLVTRLEGWALSLLEMVFGDGPEATLRRRVAVIRDATGNLDVSTFVTPFAAAASAWHLVSPDNRIVNGGPRGRHSELPSQTPEELEAFRDSGRYESHTGAVPVYGIPDTALRSPSADPDWVPDNAPREDVFRASRGGLYRWFDPEAAPSEPAGKPARATTKAAKAGDSPYEKTLAAARKAGASHAGDAGVMALFCADTLQILLGALSPELVWEGAQRRGLSAAALVSLCASDPQAVCDLQWTTG